MSSQPLQMPNTRQSLEEQRRKRAGRRADLMYFSGAVLVTAGAGLFQLRIGLLTAGTFLLFPPLLELASSFLRGLRNSRSR